jgi:hypothetical protein
VSKLPARQKATVLLFRRSAPDEILVVPREIKGSLRWSLPTEEMEAGESARVAARRIAGWFVRGDPVSEVDLGVGAEYRVGAGPRAGEWTERFHAIEVAPGTIAVEGKWLVHYDAKAEAGADAPRVREAITRLREIAKLKP